MNDEDDLKLMVRSFNKYDHLPYPELDLDVLGKIPVLACFTKEDLRCRVFDDSSS